jgi:hypothetical protein
MDLSSDADDGRGIVPGRELTVAVMGGKALAVTEIVPVYEFYDYEAKYAEGGSAHAAGEDSRSVTRRGDAPGRARACGAGLPGRQPHRFRFDDTHGKHRLILLEVNTQPGMTPTSLVPEQALRRHGFPQACAAGWRTRHAIGEGRAQPRPTAQAKRPGRGVRTGARGQAGTRRQAHAITSASASASTHFRGDPNSADGSSSGRLDCG